MVSRCEACPAFPARPSSQLDAWWESSRTDLRFDHSVESLRNRHHSSIAWLYAGGVATGFGLVTSFIVSTQCTAENCASWAVPLSVAVSIGVAAATTLGYLLIRPAEPELATVLNEWNVEHPAQPLDPAKF